MSSVCAEFVSHRASGTADGRQDDLVDHPGDRVSVVACSPSTKMPVQDDPGERRGDQVDVDVGADLAAVRARS